MNAKNTIPLPTQPQAAPQAPVIQTQELYNYFRKQTLGWQFRILGFRIFGRKAAREGLGALEAVILTSLQMQEELNELKSKKPRRKAAVKKVVKKSVKKPRSK